jgi:hypothetical protein
MIKQHCWRRKDVVKKKSVISVMYRGSGEEEVPKMPGGSLRAEREKKS